MPPYTWEKMLTLEAFDLHKEGTGFIAGQLTIWKLTDGEGNHSGVYAIGRTQETAIVTGGRDWGVLYALLANDQKVDMELREHWKKIFK